MSFLVVVVFNRGNPTRASRLNLACTTAEATIRPQWVYWLSGSIFCRPSRLLRPCGPIHFPYGLGTRYVWNTTSKQGHPTGIDPGSLPLNSDAVTSRPTRTLSCDIDDDDALWVRANKNLGHSLVCSLLCQWHSFTCFTSFTPLGSFFRSFAHSGLPSMWENVQFHVSDQPGKQQRQPGFVLLR